MQQRLYKCKLNVCQRPSINSGFCQEHSCAHPNCSGCGIHDRGGRNFCILHAPSVCVYCGEPAVVLGLCEAHNDGQH